jgi:hypothetical protein
MDSCEMEESRRVAIFYQIEFCQTITVAAGNGTTTAGWGHCSAAKTGGLLISKLRKVVIMKSLGYARNVSILVITNKSEAMPEGIICELVNWTGLLILTSSVGSCGNIFNDDHAISSSSSRHYCCF